MTQIKNNSRNESVDAFRLFAAFFVIVIHLEYPNIPRDVVVAARLVSRWAVPFFFIISGYFLALKREKNKSLDVQATIERLAWIFLVWIVIYFPLEIHDDNLNASKLLDLLTTPMFIFAGNYYHLWFIPSLLFGYLFVSICYNYNAKYLLPVMSLISLAIALFAGGYRLFALNFNLSFIIPRFWLCIPFLYIGFLIYQKGRPSWQVSAFLAVFGAALQFFEGKLIYAYFGISAYKIQFTAGTVIFAYGMACLALSDLKFLQHPLLSKWGRDYSLGIYLIHPLINFIVGGLAYMLVPVVAMNKVWQAALPITVLFLSLAALIAMNRYKPAVFNFLLGIRAPSQSDRR